MRLTAGIRRVALAVAATLAVGLVSTAVPQAAHAATCATTPYGFTWDSTKTSGLFVDLPLRTTTGSVVIDWGDNSTTTVTTTTPTVAQTHTYAAAGTYSISMCGPINEFGMGGFVTWRTSSFTGFTAVTSFPSTLTSLYAAFKGWTNLTSVPNYLPATVTTTEAAFYGATSFNDPNITSWNTANVTNMSTMFQGCTSFNQPIGSWNVGSLVYARNMFTNNVVFNQPLGSWNVSKLQDASSMFNGAAVFDQNLSAWNTSSVTDMSFMFMNAKAFSNAGSDVIKNWNTANVTNLSSTFAGTSFNQPIGSWNTSRVTSMAGTFGGSPFNQPLASWDTSSVTSMGGMFQNATAFNQPIGTWNTAKVTSMSMMFAASANVAMIFNQPIGSWNTVSVTNMSGMFSVGTNGSNVFNQPIGSWNTAKVTNMYQMFNGASVFDQDISGWSVGALVIGSTSGAASMWGANQAVMSTANYDKLLKAWSAQPRVASVQLGFGKTKYSCDAAAAQLQIRSLPINWQVTDGGLAETAPTISTIVPGNGQLSVYFTAPTCMATARTTYQYSIDGGATWKFLATPSLASPIVITGLQNGTEYPLTLRPYGGIVQTGVAATVVKGTPTSGADVKAKNDTSVYGDAVPSIGYTTTLATGDWVNTVTCGAYIDGTYATPVTAATKPGAYVTHCTGSTTSGLGSTVNYSNGTYTVTKAPLSVRAESFTKAYGDVVTLDGTADFTTSGLIGSDAVSSVTLTSSGKAASAGVAGSPYSIVPSAAVGAASKVLGDWYTITYSNGSITVNTAPALSVTPKTYTLDLGDTSMDSTSPGFDASGFVNSESFATGGYTAPTCAVYDAEVGGTAVGTTYSTLSAGTYYVRCSGGVAGNYGPVEYSVSKFVIKSANVQVTAKNGSTPYGTAPAADTGYSVSGDLNGASVTCAAFADADGFVAVTATTPPGTYYTICVGPTDNGATPAVPIVYAEGTYTVTKAPLTITAKSWSKTYGDTITVDGTTDFTVSGLVAPDGIASVTLTTSGDVATAGVAGSPYAVTPKDAVAAGDFVVTDFYDVTYVDGSITVAKAVLAVTAKNVNLSLGAAVPASYDYTVTGFVNGEAVDDPVAGWTAPTCQSSFNSTTPVGTAVDVTCAGADADNYSLSYASGSVSIGNPEVTVENTTPGAVETQGSTANVALSATITNWAPGCKVTFALNPSTGTASPYTVYTTASNDVSVNANLPVGVYDITASVSEGCTGTPDTTGVVAVVPIGPAGAAHIDTYGVKYKDATTGKTIALDMEWLRKLAKVKNPTTGQYESSYVYDSYYYWSVYGGNQYRINSKPFPGKVTIGGSTVSTWGRMDCPDGMYPVGNASICSAVTNIVTLQKWVPNSPGSKYGTWATVGDILIVEKLAQGAWPYKCATTACKTALPSYLSFQARPVPGAANPTVIPAGFPGSTDWVRISSGSIEHKQM